MSSFDKDGDGVIDCAEFLLRFFMTGFQVSWMADGGSVEGRGSRSKLQCVR